MTDEFPLDPPADYDGTPENPEGTVPADTLTDWQRKANGLAMEVADAQDARDAVPADSETGWWVPSRQLTEEERQYDRTVQFLGSKTHEEVVRLFMKRDNEIERLTDVMTKIEDLSRADRDGPWRMHNLTEINDLCWDAGFPPANDPVSPVPEGGTDDR